MAFIAGYVSERPEYTSPELLERAHAFSILPSEVGGVYEVKVVATPQGHLIIKHKTTHPLPPRLISNQHGNTLVTLGFLLAEAKDTLSAAMRTEGRALDECEGEFVAVYTDGRAIHLVNDRFGARPCYILRAEHAVYFSSNLRFLFVLARIRYRPDVVGWLEVFSHGHTLGDRTTADGIQRLRPATHLTITATGTREHQYWRLEHQPCPGLDPAKYSEEVFQAFRAGTERRAQLLGSGVLALSGGLDSRLLAGALPAGIDFSAFTFVDASGVVDTAQTRAAAAVCQELGLHHRIEPFPARVAEPGDVLALTGGLRPYQHMAIVMTYISEMRRRGRAAMLGGGPGDSLAGGFIPSPDYADPARTEECIRDARRRRLARSRLWPLVFRDDVIEGSWRAVQEELAASFDAVRGPTAAHRVTAWAMVYRQSAFTFTSVLHTHPDVAEAFCHLDYRYTDLMLRLPAPWLYNKAFYAYMIYTELPRLRHVPYANTGERLKGPLPPLELPRDTFIDRLRTLGLRARRKLGRTVFQRRAEPVRWLVLDEAALQAEVRERLHGIPALRDVLDVARCGEFLEKVRRSVYRNGGHEEVLGCLTSLCQAAETLP